MANASCSCVCCVGNYKFRNLTGQLVRIFDEALLSEVSENGAMIECGPSEELLNRLATIVVAPDENIVFDDNDTQLVSEELDDTEENESACNCCAHKYTVYYRAYTGTYTLPDPVTKTYFIVPVKLQSIFSNRDDLLSVYKPVYRKGDTSTVVGYSALFRLCTNSAPYVDPDAKETDVTVNVPSMVNGFLGGTLSLQDIVVADPYVADSDEVIRISITPRNCQIYDQANATSEGDSDDVVIISSGNTLTIQGTPAELTARFDQLSIMFSERESGSVDFAYGKEKTAQITFMTPAVVTWDDIQNKPNVVTYDDTTEDGDGFHIVLPGDVGGKIPVADLDDEDNPDPENP